MYRVVLYGLLAMAGYAILLGTFGVLSYSGLALSVSFVVLIAVCVLSNYALAWLFRVPSNPESTYITALILFFIMMPSLDRAGIGGLVIAGLVAMASKYLLTIRKQHIFNPAAIALVIVGLSQVGFALWWVGTPSMFPVVLAVCLLVVRKIRRGFLFLTTVATSVATVSVLALVGGDAVSGILVQHFLSWPIVFFAAIMVTEPFTAPPRRAQQIAYGALIGIFSSWPLHVGMVYSTPELTLVVANGVFFWLGLRQRLMLKLKEVREIAKDTKEFVFEKDGLVSFLPGQYLEWTLAHGSPDNRGIRRYFTIASSPTEADVRLGVKFYEPSSTFKKRLGGLKVGESILAGQLGGDFVLPKNEEVPLVFIAGGIGVTPFRSMVKYLIDMKQTRDVTMFYACKTADEIAYLDLFEQAKTSVGLNTVCVLSEAGEVPKGWNGEVGFVTADMVKKHVESPELCQYYLSGPSGMVNAYKKLLRDMGVPRLNIHTDYFPGFA